MSERLCVNETAGVLCGHSALDHDSGGCCKIAFCPCSRLVVPSAVGKKLTDEEIAACDGEELTPQGYMAEPMETVIRCCQFHASGGHGNAPCCTPIYSTLLDFDIHSAAFSDLAVWAYKVQEELRRLTK